MPCSCKDARLCWQVAMLRHCGVHSNCSPQDFVPFMKVHLLSQINHVVCKIELRFTSTLSTFISVHSKKLGLPITQTNKAAQWGSASAPLMCIPPQR